MNPITHFLASWSLGDATRLDERDRSLVTWCGVLPDLDGLGAALDSANSLLGRSPTLYYWEYHRSLLHGLPAAVVLPGLLATLGRRRLRVWFWGGVAVHLHLLGDLVGSRGPDLDDIWSVPYLKPFSDALTLEWRGQWPLNAWPNILLTVALLAWAFVAAVERGHSPVGVFSARADRIVVKTVRDRWASIRRFLRDRGTPAGAALQGCHAPAETNHGPKHGQATLNAMTGAREIRSELTNVARPRGDLLRYLVVGSWSILLEGLDALLAEELERRLGGFLAPSSSMRERLVVRILRCQSDRYLDRWEPGHAYRLEAEVGPEGPLVRSYHFALAPEGARAWRLGIAKGAGPDEPLGRVVENALRYLVARLAVDEGGIALHGAAVEREGRAYVLAGPSRSGKTTAVGRLAPARSLGDDFAVVLPVGGGWVVPALPFDNTERAPADPPRELFPLAGVFRLFKGKQDRVERPPLPLAIASLLACAAFPWAMPDLREKVAAQAERLATETSLAHLHFTPDSDLWSLVSGSPS